MKQELNNTFPQNTAFESREGGLPITIEVLFNYHEKVRVSGGYASKFLT